MNKLFDKVVSFLLSFAVNGFLAIFVTALIFLLLIILMAFVLIPVQIIAGEAAASAIKSVLGHKAAFPVVYAIVFFYMMADDLRIPGAGTLFERWKKKKQPAQKAS